MSRGHCGKNSEKWNGMHPGRVRSLYRDAILAYLLSGPLTVIIVAMQFAGCVAEAGVKSRAWRDGEVLNIHMWCDRPHYNRPKVKLVFERYQ